jgi:hypothetical protein
MGKGKKHNLNWIKATLELKDDHRWQSAPGTQIFVAGRGAVRFDIPQDWHFSPQESSFQFLDKTPPDDNCRLEVSYNLLPHGNWSEFPLAPLLKNLVREDSRFSGEVGEIHYLKRQTARVVWTEFPFIDPHEHRPALARVAIGLGSNVQCLITLDFWEDEAEKFTPVWDLVLSSLVLGLFIKDPRTGLALPD